MPAEHGERQSDDRGESATKTVTSGAGSSVPTSDHDSAPRAGGGDLPFEHTTVVAGDPIPGTTRVGNYQLKRAIGIGGMGAVYEALQDQPRRIVAVKLLRHPITSPANLRRFESESQLLARLRHPGIAQVYEAGTHMHGEIACPWYAMEFIPEARTLLEYATAKKLSTRERLELFCRACDAVHHANQKGIIHRDIKPQNILVDSGGQPKVIDFGIARSADAAELSLSLQTDPNQLLGTLQYMSPEQIDGDPHALDARADVYSLGVVLYELLCGKLPYQVSSQRLHEASRIIKEEPPLKPRELKPELPKDLETVLLKALHKEKERRYASASDLANDVRRVLNDEPIEARRDSVVYVVRTRTRAAAVRHRVAVPLLLVAMAVVLSLVGISKLDNALGWTRWFERKMTTTWIGGNRDAPLRHVTMITLDDAVDLKSLAHELRLTQLDPQVIRSWRALIGRLLQRLANSGASAVFLDLEYAQESVFDDQLMIGLEACRRANVPVVLSTVRWPLDNGDHPSVANAILPYVRWGGITINLSKDAPVSLHLAVRRGIGQSIPSAALAVYAAVRHPEATPRFNIDGERDAIIINYDAPAPVASEWLEATTVRHLPDDHAQFNLRKTDAVAYYTIAVASQKALQRSVVRMDQVALASPDQLAQWFSGKTIVVALPRAGIDREFDYPDGSRMAGAYAHAAGIDALLSGKRLRRPGSISFAGIDLNAGVLSALLAAGIGAVIGICFHSREWWWRRGLMAAAAVGVIAISIALYRGAGLLHPPWSAAFALIVTCELVAAVRQVARRDMDGC